MSWGEIFALYLPPLGAVAAPALFLYLIKARFGITSLPSLVVSSLFTGACFYACVFALKYVTVNDMREIKSLISVGRRINMPRAS